MMGDGIRETINRYGAIAAFVAAIVIVIATVRLYREVRDAAPPPPPKAYYTSDDGATWFEDDPRQFSPIIRDGKEAVRAYVFVCPDGKPFVGYLERLDDATIARLRELQAEGRFPSSEMMMILSEGAMVKRPGEGQWVYSRDFDAAQSIVQLQCKDGSYPAMAR